jgi:hypothetical protein
LLAGRQRQQQRQKQVLRFAQDDKIFLVCWWEGNGNNKGKSRSFALLRMTNLFGLLLGRQRQQQRQKRVLRFAQDDKIFLVCRREDNGKNKGKSGSFALLRMTDWLLFDAKAET